MGFRVCGPKLSLCGALLSVWGILQLGLMAVFMYFNSVAFIEDLKLPEELEKSANTTATDLISAIGHSYGETARNCGIAAALYVLTLLFSVHQMWINNHFTPTSPTAYVRQYDNIDMQQLSS